jgi:hypothetical protein
MEAPQKTEAHDLFKKFVGTWRGEERIQPSQWTPQGDTATSQIRNQIGLDGYVLIQDIVQSRGGQVMFRAHNLLRWDEQDQTYVMYWFDSNGFPPSELRGRLDGQVLTLSGRDPAGFSRLVYHLEEDGRYSYQMFGAADGESWELILEGIYHRV